MSLVSQKDWWEQLLGAQWRTMNQICGELGHGHTVRFRVYMCCLIVWFFHGDNASSETLDKPWNLSSKYRSCWQDAHIQNTGIMWRKVGREILIAWRFYLLLTFLSNREELGAYRHWTATLSVSVYVDLTARTVTHVRVDKSLRPKEMSDYCVTGLCNLMRPDLMRCRIMILEDFVVHSTHREEASVIHFRYTNRHRVMIDLASKNWAPAIAHEWYFVYLTGSRKQLSIVKCRGDETQKWDFSIYPSLESPAKKEESTQNADGQNPALAKEVLQEVLRVYDRTTDGRYNILAMRIHAYTSLLSNFFLRVFSNGCRVNTFLKSVSPVWCRIARRIKTSMFCVSWLQMISGAPMPVGYW